eukprot:11159152-Lingulodinium_polyedra.AAC.1
MHSTVARITQVVHWQTDGFVANGRRSLASKMGRGRCGWQTPARVFKDLVRSCAGATVINDFFCGSWVFRTQ